MIRIRPGKPYPLGASFDGDGVNFSVFSSVADRVELCLFDSRGEECRYDLPEMSAFCWHGYIAGLRPGQRYGFRIDGPWEPHEGLRCNSAKLLLDPYAKCIDGMGEWNEALLPHTHDPPWTSRNEADSAPYTPRSVIVDANFDWQGDRPFRTPWDVTVIYEAHVKGFTMRHPDIPQQIRGTYSGLAHPKSIAHLKMLGVTAVELMPIHQFLHDFHLLDRGLKNYWGYNTIGFFAPHNEYFTSADPAQQIVEFKRMVRALHEAGLEVILDVAYGHTAEGNHLGPAFCFKGIDNPGYYRLVDGNSFYYIDHTGTGNSLNTRQPCVVQLLMDSLRYWVTEMHVDGFRFDLAATLARGVHDVDRLSAFFEVVQQDPVVSQVKLIAEPWDLGEGGYQLGNFPPLWSEWNGKFRDGMRDFWRGNHHMLSEFACRLAGSADLYKSNGRSPAASINFITCHDGFTLTDLVSYDRKHNHTNSERNGDGEHNNRAWNCGMEGPTSDAATNELRARQKRNFIATLLLSRGVPMLLSGDELGRTQLGNNNAYCQDNKVSWIDWENVDQDFFQFVSGMLRLRRENGPLHRLHFLNGAGTWFRNDGQPMNQSDWDTGYAKALGVLITTDESYFYAAFNAHFGTVPFRIPDHLVRDWTVLVNTMHRTVLTAGHPLNDSTFSVAPHSMVLLRASSRSSRIPVLLPPHLRSSTD